MTIFSGGQVTLLPVQLSRLAELYPDGGAVGLSQDGSIISASNGRRSVTINAQGKKLEDSDSEGTFPLC